MNVNYIALIIFIIISICNIYFVKVGNKKGIYITKPLLMPMLIIFYVLSTTNINWLIVSALIFGCIGDILLMGPKSLFIGGLISFLVGHIFYIKAFIDPMLDYNIANLAFILAIPYIICNMLIIRSVLPYKKLKNVIKFFGFIYVIVISFMGFSSTIRIFYVQGFKFFATFLGSMLFIISDSLIAFSDLKYKSKYSGVLIMSTYILGQFLIVLGFI